MWRRIGALIVKELLSVWRDKQTRFVVIGPPMIQLIIFSYAITFDITNVTLAVLDQSRSPESRELISRFEGADAFATILPLERVADIDPTLDSRRAHAVLHIGPDFARRLRGAPPAPVQLLLDGRTSNTALIIQGYASAIVQRFNLDWAAEHHLATTPTALTTRAWFNPNLHTRWMLVPSLMGVLTMIVTLILTGVSVARERELGTMEQLLVTPLRPAEIILGKTIPALLVGFGEGTAIAAAAVFWFGIPFGGSLILLYLSLFVFLLSVIGVGLFLSSLAKTQQQAVLGGFLFIVPAILLSGFATPIENMPEWLQTATLVNPLRFFLVIVRGVFLKALPPDVVFQQLWPMMVIALVTLVGAVAFFRRRLY